MTTALTTQNMDQERIELIKQTVAKGATDLEFELFLHACKHTGLDPLMKQIYAIKRWSQTEQREVMSFQTGIDGYRLIADRTGKYAGSSDAIFEEKDGKPILAQVTVLKNIDGEKCAFTASARWEEYVQRNRQMEPTSMWKKMPFLMLAKCAEAQALRKAFPMELSGLYTNEEMEHLDSEWKPQIRTGQEMLAQMEANPPIDAAAPRGGKTSQEEGLANETVKSGGQAKGSVHEPEVEEVMRDIEQTSGSRRPGNTQASSVADAEQADAPASRDVLPPIHSVCRDYDNAPDQAAKVHILNEALSKDYSQADKALLIKKVKGVKK